MEWQPKRAQIRALRGQIAAITSSILNTHDVVDLTMEEVPIDEMIRKIL